METRKYFSIRTGKNPNTKFTLEYMCSLFSDLFDSYFEKGYFQEAFGYYCVDQGNVSGTLGSNIVAQIFRILRKSDIWPIRHFFQSYSEDDLFDMIEFTYDYVSKPIPKDKDYHSYSQCGYHYSQFDRESGREEYRKEVNKLLLDYQDGFELSEQGEILYLGTTGLGTLLEAPVVSNDPENISNKVELAILKFRRAKSTVHERKDAIRELADVLEFLREKAKEHLESQDEKDIFNLANNFGIRHHNSSQKTKYDNSIWYSWMFYYYLATIHALTRVI